MELRQSGLGQDGAPSSRTLRLSLVSRAKSTSAWSPSAASLPALASAMAAENPRSEGSRSRRRVSGRTESAEMPKMERV